MATNIILLLSASLLAFLISEITVRIYLSSKRNDLDSLRKYHQQQPAPHLDKPLELADIVEIWGNDLRVYRLRPGIQGQFINHPLFINEDGYRGHRLSPDKASDRFRIIGIGDSVMFGWGVPFDETYLNLLIEYLNSHKPEGSQTIYEVVNLATPGYNAIMEAELLRESGLPLQPDLVILGFVENDATIPNFIRRRENYWAINRLFLWELIQANWEARTNTRLADAESALTAFSPPGLEHAFNRERVDWELEDNNWKVKWMKVPPEYEYLHGWDKVEKAFGMFRDMSQQGRFPVVMLTDYYLLDKYIRGEVKEPDRDIARALEMAAANELVIADSLDLVTRLVEDSGMSDKDALWLSPEDSHPNLARQRLLAATLYRALVMNDLIPDAALRRNSLEADMQWWYEQAIECLNATPNAKSVNP